MEENKNKSLIIIVILVILLLGSIGYIVYDNFIKEDEVVENNDKNNNNQDNEQNNEEDEIQLPKEDEEVANIGRDLFERTNKHIYVADNTYILYQEKDVYYDDLSNKDKLALAYNLIPNEEKNIDSSAYTNSSCYDGGYICPAEGVSRDLFEEYYHKMFGLDKNVEFEEIFILRSDYDIDSIVDGIWCNLENDEFVCYPIDGGGVSMYYNYIEYNRTVCDGDDLLVYVNFLVDGCSSGHCGIYADRKFTKFIADNIDYEDESELFDLYRDEAGLYKLTFRKDVNGNYYWYSSEIVK